MMWHAHFVSIVTSTFVQTHQFHPIGQTWTKNISHSICPMDIWWLKTNRFIIISTTKIVQSKVFGCQVLVFTTSATKTISITTILTKLFQLPRVQWPAPIEFAGIEIIFDHLIDLDQFILLIWWLSLGTFYHRLGRFL